VMGHVGLMPQRVQVSGGYKIVGRDDAGAEQVMRDALALQEAGAFAVVLECVTEDVAAAVTNKLNIPTIGIGSGKYCSGQVQVIADLLGLQEFKPKHAKRYLEGAEIISAALKSYADEVRNGTFPTEEHSFK